MKTCRCKQQTESSGMWSLLATYTRKIVIKLYSATSAILLLESERKKNGRYCWQRHNQHALKLIRRTESRMSFLPPCRMNCGLLSLRSSAGHSCLQPPISISSRPLVRSKPSLATLELKGDSSMNCLTSRASRPANSASTHGQSDSHR